MFVLLYKETLLNINDFESSLLTVVSTLLQEFKYVILEDDPNGLSLEETKKLQSQVEELIIHVLYMYYLNKKRINRGFHAINNIVVKIRGRIFSRKGGMMRIKVQRIRDAGASITYTGNSILIMENSYSGGCETLETLNMFQNPSILSLVTIFIWTYLILKRFVLQVKVVVDLFNLESLFC